MEKKEIKSVEDLDVFKLAHISALQIYKLTSNFPNEELYGLTSQIKRSAGSIGANLCEGSNRLSSSEYRHFVSIARGSAAETRYHLLLAKDLGYIDKETYLELKEGYDNIGKMLTGLAYSLEKE
jgi:four helix bundle protein